MFFQGVGKRSVWTQSAFVMPMMRGADAIYENQTNYWTEDNPDLKADFRGYSRVTPQEVRLLSWN